MCDLQQRNMHAIRSRLKMQREIQADARRAHSQLTNNEDQSRINPPLTRNKILWPPSREEGNCKAYKYPARGLAPSTPRLWRRRCLDPGPFPFPTKREIVASTKA